MPIISQNKVKKYNPIKFSYSESCKGTREQNSHWWWGKTNDLASLW